MTRPSRRIGAACVAVATLTWLATFSTVAPAQSPLAYAWKLPRGFPLPKVPADNPMTAAKAELGRHLFYDTRLSSTGTFSCATCHEQARAFTDGKARAVGVTGQAHPRGAMSLTNVAYNPVFTWANPTVTRLEDQALVPMFGTEPVELGLAGQERALLARLESEPKYRTLFPQAFPDDEQPFTVGTVTKAIASFERTLLSGGSPYDRYRTMFDANAISPAAHRGEELFFSERVGCFNCHAGINFTEAVDFEKRVPRPVGFHNTGLYNIDGKGSYPSPNTGVHAVTGTPADMGRFRPPTLRNIALTAPYMHDGAMATLEEVVDHFASGGLSHPNKDPLMTPFTLSAQERADLLAFLNALTDERSLDQVP